MELIPIQVTEEGVVIPKTYLQGASDVEVIWSEDYILVKPKIRPAQRSGKSGKHRYSFIGIAQTRNPTASTDAEEILAREVDRRSGWSHNP
jgi:hypothetical protein